MPEKIVALFAAVATFIGLRKRGAKPGSEDRIVDSYNKSRQKWISNGWIKKEEKPATPKV